MKNTQSYIVVVIVIVAVVVLLTYGDRFYIEWIVFAIYVD